MFLLLILRLEKFVSYSTHSLPSLSGSHWSEVVALDWVLSMGQIELFDCKTECKQMTYAKLNCLK